MKSMMFVLLSGILSFANHLSGEIHMCNSLPKCVADMKLQEGDLVVFDIDMTLLAPVEPALFPSQWKKHGAVLKQLTHWTPLLKDIALNLIVHNARLKLIDQQSPKVISDIQKQGVPVIALTACLTHPCGGVATPEYRFEQLKEHGIHMSNPTLSTTPLPLDDLELVLGHYPSYYCGV